MSVNLIQAIQTNLQYPELQKIDPNTQEVKTDDATPNEHRFSQAAIPVMLTGLYKYSTTDIGAENILRGDFSTNWVNTVFENTSGEVIQKVADYSSMPAAEAEARMNDIADEAIHLAKENVKPEASMMEVKQYFSNQRNNILLYLPPALHMGELLKDDTLDDNTNKMEGPISSLMHKIGSAFSNPESEEEMHTKQ